MELSQLQIHLKPNEVCDLLTAALRKALPGSVLLHSAAMYQNVLTLRGHVDKAGGRDFTLVFKVRLSTDRSAVLARLDDAEVSGMWHVFTASVVNLALSRSLPNLSGLSYSFVDRELSLAPAELLPAFGIVFTGRIATMDFSNGLSLSITSV